MDRREYLHAVAGGGAAALTAASGCLGGSAGGPALGPDPGDDDPADGYPPAVEDTPAPEAIDTGAFDAVDVDGTAVPLAPIDAAYHWYRRREARFADARGREQFRNSHVYGAVLSPAPDGRANDPVADWPSGDRIVCYCGCPHHLSSLRAASLIEAGYESVFVIDEGFWAWHDRGYPMAGRDVTATPPAAVVTGVAAARFAGETAWAVHEPSGQREAAPIGADGSYRLELRFVDLGPDAVVRVATPGYTVERPLSTLVERPVTAAMARDG